MAVSIAPLTTAVMNSVAPENVGVASGVNNAASRVAGLLAIALLGIVLSATFGGSLERRLSTLPIDAAARHEVLAARGELGAAVPPARLPPDQAEFVRAAIARSFVAGFRDLARLAALLSVLAAGCAFVWIRDDGKRRSTT